MSGQIEVLPGAHLVASARGAVVVVAHRDDRAVTADSVAARTMTALLDIVREAGAEDPRRGGRRVARLATNWLMSLPGEAEDDVEFGVITPVESGVAVFLHGGVSAVLAGSGRTEVLRGQDAGFTVDRVVLPAPVFGTGLFVDEAGWRAESLPGRGVFALADGMVPGSGAVLWPAVDAGMDEPAAESPMSERASCPPGPGEYARGSSAVPAPVSSGFVAGSARASEGAAHPPLNLRKVESEGAAADSDAGASSTGTGSRGREMPPTRELGPMPMPGAGKPEPVYSSPRERAIATDAGLAETMVPTAGALALTPERPGSGPMPRREILVPGLQCPRGHHNDPRVSCCAVCGVRMDQIERVLIEAVRPPLGVLLLDDGTRFVLDTDCVLGREPEHAEAVARGAVPVRLEDRSGGMSREHVEIRLVGWDVVVVDGGSTNGTQVRLPGSQEWVAALPGQPLQLMPGAEVQLGGRMVTFDAPAGRL